MSPTLIIYLCGVLFTAILLIVLNYHVGWYKREDIDDYVQMEDMFMQFFLISIFWPIAVIVTLFLYFKKHFLKILLP